MMKSNKVLMLYIEPTPYILDLLNQLQKTGPIGFDVCFLAENVSQTWNLEVNSHHEILPHSRSKAIQHLVKKVKHPQYKVIHLAGWGHQYLLLALLIAWFYRKKTIVESDTQTVKSGKKIRQLIKRIAYPYLFKMVNCFLPGGKRQAVYLMNYGVSQDKIVNANMTVDVTKMIIASDKYKKNKTALKQRWHIKNESVVFVFVGRLEKHKGVEQLIHAFNQVSSSFNTVLLIVGDGSLRQFVNDQIKCNKKIKYLGRLDQSDIIKIFSLANVSVVPSEFEPWGLVVNEAMACGVPVLATKAVGCVDDLVLHGKTGIVIQNNDIDKLKHVFYKILNKEIDITQLAEHARNLISGWTLENEVKNIQMAWQR